MKCKACGKELIGKEKFFCRSCSVKGKDIVIKTGKGVVGIGAVFFLLKKMTNFLKGKSNDV